VEGSNLIKAARVSFKTISYTSLSIYLLLVFVAFIKIINIEIPLGGAANDFYQAFNIAHNSLQERSFFIPGQLTSNFGFFLSSPLYNYLLILLILLGFKTIELIITANILFQVLGLLFLYWAGRKMLSEEVSAIAIILILVSETGNFLFLHPWIPYTFLPFVSIGLYLFATGYTDKNNKYVIASNIFILAASLIYAPGIYLFLFLFLISLIYFIYNKEKTQAYVQLVSSTALFFILFTLPGWFALFSNNYSTLKSHYPIFKIGKTVAGIFSIENLKISLAAFNEMLFRAPAFFQGDIAQTIFFIILLVGFIGYFTRKQEKRSYLFTIFALSAVVVSIIFLNLLGGFFDVNHTANLAKGNNPRVADRHLYPIFPLLFLVFAEILIKGYRHKTAITKYIFVLLFVLILGNGFSEPPHPQSNNVERIENIAKVIYRDTRPINGSPTIRFNIYSHEESITTPDVLFYYVQKQTDKDILKLEQGIAVTSHLGTDFERHYVVCFNLPHYVERKVSQKNCLNDFKSKNENFVQGEILLQEPLANVYIFNKRY